MYPYTDSATPERAARRRQHAWRRTCEAHPVCGPLPPPPARARSRQHGKTSRRGRGAHDARLERSTSQGRQLVGGEPAAGQHAARELADAPPREHGRPPQSRSAVTLSKLKSVTC
jgi:hypothetical protein